MPTSWEVAWAPAKVGFEPSQLGAQQLVWKVEDKTAGRALYWSRPVSAQGPSFRLPHATVHGAAPPRVPALCVGSQQGRETPSRASPGVRTPRGADLLRMNGDGLAVLLFTLLPALRPSLPSFCSNHQEREELPTEGSPTDHDYYVFVDCSVMPVLGMACGSSLQQGPCLPSLHWQANVS